MFTLPKGVVLKIISGGIDCDSVPWNGDNEVSKGYKFEDQARVNLRLEKNYVAKCSVLEGDCKKEGCVLFVSGQMGKIDDGWVCREFKVDFPDAPFDARGLRWRVGTDKIDLAKSLKEIERLRRRGGIMFV